MKKIEMNKGQDDISNQEFFVIPEEESKMVIITPTKVGATLKLDKKRALLLCKIIQDCVQKW